MRLSVEIHTLQKRYGDEKAIAMLKKAGFDSVDYSFFWLSKEEPVLGENYREYAAKVRRCLEEHGMTCNQAHAPFSVKYGSPFNDTDPDYLDVVHSIEAAAIMGADNIIVHSLSTPANVDTFAYNLEYYNSLKPYCEKFGICIAIENLFWIDENSGWIRGRLHTPEELNAMVKALDSPWFVVCIDVGHAGLTGYKPEELISCFEPEVLKALHLHDNDYLSDRHTIPYGGSFQWDNIMEALGKIRYTGDFTYEILGYLNKIDDEMMEETLAYAAKMGRHLIAKYDAVK